MTELNNSERKVLSAFHTFRGNGPGFLVATAGALLAIHPIGSAEWFPDKLSFVARPWFFFLAVAMYVVAIIMFFVRRETFGSLTEKVRDLERTNEKTSRDLVAVLRELIRQLVVQEDLDTVQNRISLYRHYNGKFYLLARYSRNPNYQATGRRQYPDNEGIIGHCWTRGSGQVRDLPSDESSWIENATEKYGIPADVARDFKMKPRSLMGVRLDCGETGSIPTGVIVVESTEPRGMAGKLDALVASDMVDLIKRTLQVSIQSLPMDGREVIQQINRPNP